jgi:hypothetical protein
MILANDARNPSAMYYVLSILVHRPFIADGHLHSNSRTISVNSFITCATAASNIVSVLEAYDEAFSVRRAPYLISYATYVAATIHARIAAQKGPGSEAHRSLEICLAVFQDNQETNSAVRRANVIVQNLMKKLGVTRSEDDTSLPNARDFGAVASSDEAERRGSGDRDRPNVNANQQTSRYDVLPKEIAESNLDSFEIDGIIRMFTQEQRTLHPVRDAHLLEPSQLDVSDAAHQSMHQSSHFEHRNDGQDRQLYNIVAAPGSTDTSTNLQSGLFLNAYASNDLLFGFNGSALDAFPAFEWGN